MAIVKEVTELHGGYVDIASSLGKGTSITLFLPASTERVDAA
jgi:signal transduction histidine kinase